MQFISDIFDLWEVVTKQKMNYCAVLILFCVQTILATQENTTLTVTDKIWLDIEIEGNPIGRIEIGVFGEIVPKTAKVRGAFFAFLYVF